MTSSRPISAARTVWLIARLSLRRQVNLWQSARLGRKKKDALTATATGEQMRTASPTKRRGRSIFSAFILLVMAFNGFNIGSRGLVSLSEAARNVTISPDGIAVSSETKARLAGAERALQRASELADPDEREKYAGAWNRYVHALFEGEVRREGLSEEDENSRLQQMHEAFERKGAAGFVEKPPATFWVSGEIWPRVGQPSSIFLRSLSLIVLLWIPFILFGSLGMNNKNLGEVEWNFEWLYTFPASARRLFASKLFVYSFLNPLVWLFFYPFLILVYVSAGFGFNAVFVGLGVLLYLMLLTGALCTFLEVALRKLLSLNQLKNIQAIFTIVGSAALLLVYAACLSKPLDDFLVARAGNMPEFLAWNPFTLPLVLGSPLAGALQVRIAIGAMIVLSTGCCALALIGSEWLTRDGLVRAGGPYQGTRRAAEGHARKTWLRGVASHEMLLLGRDRNLLVQVVFVPLLVPAFYLLIYSGMLSAVSSNFRHAAVMAFGVGAYSFMSSAMPILDREGKTLWQLFTFPQSLTNILLKKAMVWAALGLLYGGCVLLLLLRFSRHLHVSSGGQILLALYGIALYGFIASGIGILATNVLETERRARFRTDMVYLYMILAAMYTNTIYSGSIWAKLAQLVLSTLLAFALWQKVKDAAPYFLDPVALPARSLSLADGLIAALAFFVAQGLIYLFIHAVSNAPSSVQITIAYTLAGLIVSGFTLYTLWRQELNDLWEEIGLSRSKGERMVRPIGKGVLYAVGLGALAGITAIVYVRGLSLFPQGQVWQQDAQLSSFLSRAERPIWMCILAIVAAPVFEEFLFRGLIFQGLRRTTGPAVAVLGSAALFALVHPPISVIPVFGLGVAAAISFRKAGFLLAPVVTHAVYNTIVIFMNKL